jgi:hypothetical protein
MIRRFKELMRKAIITDTAEGSAYRIWFAFLTGFAVMFHRAWPRLHRPEIWAEDGGAFLQNWLHLSFDSIFLPIVGSYQVVQRLLTGMVAAFSPVAEWPYFLGLPSIVLLAVIGSTFARIEYRWLVPSHHARFLVGFLVFFSPGLFEMVGNIANINWMLLVWLALVGLRDPKVPFNLWEIILAIFIIGSVGTSILLLPLFIWRFVYGVRYARNLTQKVQESAVLSAIILMNLVLISLKGGTTEPFPAALRERIDLFGPQMMLRNFYELLVFRPWFGESFTATLEENSNFHFFDIGLRVLFVLVIGAWITKNWKNPKVHALLLFSSGFVVWPVLVWFARPGSLDVFINGAYWDCRYSFPTGVIAPFVWMSFLSPQTLFKKWRPSLGLVFLCIAIHQVEGKPRLPSFQKLFPDPSIRWSEWSTRVEKELNSPCKSDLTVPHFPPGFGMVIRTSWDRPDCNL